MFRRKRRLTRVHQSDGLAETRGKLVFDEDTRILWPSQRQAAKAMGISPNKLSKLLKSSKRNR